MRQYTRRDVLGSTVGAATLLAGCSESESAGSFTETSVEDQQLVVEFDESLEAETISVVDPDGESFAETDVSAGVSRVTFDISMPYTPGEYRIVAADGDEPVAETTQEIRPNLKIVDVGVGANRMDEMPDSLGHTKNNEALVVVENTGNGPDQLQQLQFLGDLPNPERLEGDQAGLLDPNSGTRINEPLALNGQRKKTLFSNTLPFSFEGDGIDCSSNSQEGEFTVEIQGSVSGKTTAKYSVEYSAADSYDGCSISVREVS